MGINMPNILMDAGGMCQDGGSMSEINISNELNKIIEQSFINHYKTNDI